MRQKTNWKTIFISYLTVIYISSFRLLIPCICNSVSAQKKRQLIKNKSNQRKRDYCTMDVFANLNLVFVWMWCFWTVDLSTIQNTFIIYLYLAVIKTLTAVKSFKQHKLSAKSDHVATTTKNMCMQGFTEQEKYKTYCMWKNHNKDTMKEVLVIKPLLTVTAAFCAWQTESRSF